MSEEVFEYVSTREYQAYNVFCIRKQRPERFSELFMSKIAAMPSVVIGRCLQFEKSFWNAAFRPRDLHAGCTLHNNKTSSAKDGLGLRKTLTSHQIVRAFRTLVLTQLDVSDDLKLWSAAGIIHYLTGPPIRIPCTVAVRALADFLFGATINVGIDVRLTLPQTV
ncbi:hypothetical protein BC629DRAFT_1438787 [Irpex lacteus]|nr:hypothetical protein BC629DRAFT_1438787 [Irpex lacteus]